MGHVPVSGADGSLRALSGLRRPRKVFVHVNNTNPMLDESGPEYREVRDGRLGSSGGRVAAQSVETMSGCADSFSQRAESAAAAGWRKNGITISIRFTLMMHEGQLSRGQMQAWALNRYYYQSRIPIKDAIILSRSDDPDFRRAWRKRVVDHDGDSAQEGGIERWIRLAEATGLDRQRVMGCDEVLPAIRYAVDAYLDLVKNRTFLEAVASSLTELFSRDLIALRMDRLRQHYPWLSSGLDYFTARLHQAPEDARFALQWVTDHAHTRAEQELAIARVTGKMRHSLGATGRACTLPTCSRDGLRRAHFEWSRSSASPFAKQPAAPGTGLPMGHPWRDNRWCSFRKA